jgi:hypothetical protein
MDPNKLYLCYPARQKGDAEDYNVWYSRVVYAETVEDAKIQFIKWYMGPEWNVREKDIRYTGADRVDVLGWDHITVTNEASLSRSF